MTQFLLFFFGIFIGIIIGKIYTDFNWKKIKKVEIVKEEFCNPISIIRMVWKDKPNISKWRFNRNTYGNILFNYEESDASFRTRIKQKIKEI